MGVRYRKSFSYKGFRVNFSKSGVGYSYGVPGFRYTVMADGRERVTLSIPGTGLSWVEESSNKKREADQKQQAIDSGNYHTIRNASVEEMTTVEYKDFTDECRKHILDSLKWEAFFKTSAVLLGFASAFLLLQILNIRNHQGSFLFILALLLVGGLAYGTYYSYCNRKQIKQNKVKLIYSFDGTPNPYTALYNAMEKTSHSQSIYCGTSFIANAKGRINAGATNIYDLHPVTLQVKAPDFLETNVRCYCLDLPNEDLYILPDKLLFVVDKSRVGAVDINSLQISLRESNFREMGNVPEDTTILAWTYQYVNNDGSPDRRYKDNRQVPICKYGQMDVSSPEGINLRFFCSNMNCAISFYHQWLETKKPDENRGSKPFERTVDTKQAPVKEQRSKNIQPTVSIDPTINDILDNANVGDRVYYGNSNERYMLGEIGNRNLICFGVNPSTASDTSDDPTIRKIRKLAEENKYDGWIMLNLYPQRATNPNELHTSADQDIIQKNVEVIKYVLSKYPDSELLASWGDLIGKRDYLKECLVKILDIDYDRAWRCRGELTASNNPRHQLYVANGTTLKELIFDGDGNILGSYTIE